jgi:hypothetical protein
MSQFRTIFAAFGLALCFSLSAHSLPADPKTEVSVVPLPLKPGSSSVGEATLERTLSGTTLKTQAAFRVTFTNKTTNSLNRVFFQGDLNTDSTTGLTFSEVIPDPTTSCVITGANDVNCVPNNLTKTLAPGKSLSFIGVVDVPGNGSYIDLAWLVGGDEGQGGGNGCCNKSGTTRIELVDSTLSATYKSQLSSFLKVAPTAGNSKTFFTGDLAVSTDNDGWTTTVKVPGFVGLSTIEIDEGFSDSCSPIAVSGGCFRTDLKIPDFLLSGSDVLEITIRWDRKYFNLGGYKAENLRLRYSPTNEDGSLGTEIEVGLCGTGGPTKDIPCMPVPPKKLSGSDTSIKELIGDLEFKVWAKNNGRYAQ